MPRRRLEALTADQKSLFKVIEKRHPGLGSRLESELRNSNFFAFLHGRRHGRLEMSDIEAVGFHRTCDQHWAKVTPMLAVERALLIVFFQKWPQRDFGAESTLRLEVMARNFSRYLCGKGPKLSKAHCERAIEAEVRVLYKVVQYAKSLEKINESVDRKLRKELQSSGAWKSLRSIDNSILVLYALFGDLRVSRVADKAFCAKLKKWVNQNKSIAECVEGLLE